MTSYNLIQTPNMKNYGSDCNNWMTTFVPDSTLFTQTPNLQFDWKLPLFNFNSVSDFNTNFFNFIPQIQWQMPVFNFNNDYNFAFDTNFKNFKPQNYNYSRRVSGNINGSYANLSRSAAYKKAQSDPNLENISSGGNRWQISKSSFRTDIPFARKGTKLILDKVTSIIGENLVITSALGTGEAGNPHVRSGYASHHNADNPKLDISTHGKNAHQLAAKLRNTGYFSRVSIESDHLDVQIDPKKFNTLNTMA